MAYNLLQTDFQTSMVYVLSVYNASGAIGIITELQQVCLAIYDTGIVPFSYTGSSILTLQITRYR